LHRKFDLPDLFLVISLGAIAFEAALGAYARMRAEADVR
jgi:hypothetical protein